MSVTAPNAFDLAGRVAVLTPGLGFEHPSVFADAVLAFLTDAPSLGSDSEELGEV